MSIDYSKDVLNIERKKMIPETPLQSPVDNLTNDALTWHEKKMAAFRTGVFSALAAVLSIIIQYIINPEFLSLCFDSCAPVVNGQLVFIIIFMAGFYLLIGYLISFFIYSRVSSRTALKKRGRILLLVIAGLTAWSILNRMGLVE